MKRIALLLCMGLWLYPSFSMAQGLPYLARSTNTVTYSSAGLIVIPFDKARVSWMIHPENESVRCEFGDVHGNPPATTPSSTVGAEFVSGGYFTNTPYSPASVEIDCFPETGTVNLDVIGDDR